MVTMWKQLPGNTAKEGTVYEEVAAVAPAGLFVNRMPRCHRMTRHHMPNAIACHATTCHASHLCADAAVSRLLDDMIKTSSGGAWGKEPILVNAKSARVPIRVYPSSSPKPGRP